MKLSTRDANAYFARPDPTKTGLLIYGGDAMRVALKRQEFLKALLGKDAEEEMRLTRIQAAELRREPALLMDAIKAVGFFPGPRAAFVEDANDNIERMLADAQLQPEPDAMAALSDLARAVDPGDFRQTLEKITLYKMNDATPLTVDDVAACAPTSTEADVDDILHVVAEARARDIGPVMAKLQAQGVNAVTLTIMAIRHFRTLYRIAANPGGPVYGVRDRDRAQRQAKSWGAHKLETALTVLTDTDLTLRSAGQNAPALALVERAFIRLAMLGAQR